MVEDFAVKLCMYVIVLNNLEQFRFVQGPPKKHTHTINQGLCDTFFTYFSQLQGFFQF